MAFAGLLLGVAGIAWLAVSTLLAGQRERAAIQAISEFADIRVTRRDPSFVARLAGRWIGSPTTRVEIVSVSFTADDCRDHTDELIRLLKDFSRLEMIWFHGSFHSLVSRKCVTFNISRIERALPEVVICVSL